MRRSLPLVLFSIVILSGCGSSTKPAQTGQGEIRIVLVDRPAGYDAVNIVVNEVSVHLSGADSLSGWIVVDSTPRTFDLLTLTNGASRVLGDRFLDAGHYTQIRLALSDSCTVVVDGQTHPLEVPSGTRTGLKLNHPFDIAPNTLYELTLDFDAMRSIHVTGNDRYILSPVIRVVANQVSDAISGTIHPVGANAEVFTLVGADTVSTATDTTTGTFMLMALPANTYSIHITPFVFCVSGHHPHGDIRGRRAETPAWARSRSICGDEPEELRFRGLEETRCATDPPPRSYPCDSGRRAFLWPDEGTGRGRDRSAHWSEFPGSAGRPQKPGQGDLRGRSALGFVEPMGGMDRPLPARAIGVHLSYRAVAERRRAWKPVAALALLPARRSR